MDHQDSARFEETAIKRSCQRVRNAFVATGDHRIAGWSQQAASQNPGIACGCSQEPWPTLTGIRVGASTSSNLCGVAVACYLRESERVIRTDVSACIDLAPGAA